MTGTLISLISIFIGFITTNLTGIYKKNTLLDLQGIP